MDLTALRGSAQQLPFGDYLAELFANAVEAVISVAAKDRDLPAPDTYTEQLRAVTGIDLAGEGWHCQSVFSTDRQTTPAVVALAIHDNTLHMEVIQPAVATSTLMTITTCTPPPEAHRNATVVIDHAMRWTVVGEPEDGRSSTSCQVHYTIDTPMTSTELIAQAQREAAERGMVLPDTLLRTAQQLTVVRRTTLGFHGDLVTQPIEPGWWGRYGTSLSTWRYAADAVDRDQLLVTLPTEICPTPSAPEPDTWLPIDDGGGMYL